MKNFVWLYSLILLLCSCSSSIERDARAQMELTMKELAKDPSSMKIADVKTMFSNDSLCILHFRFSAKNGFGAMRTSLYEYVYLIRQLSSKNETRLESVINLEDKDEKSVLDQARSNYNERFLEYDSISSLKDEDRKTWHIRFASEMHMIFGGRVVGEDKYNIDNW